MYISVYIYIYFSSMDTWTGKNYESLHCCGKFAFTSDDTEERWMLCVLFFFFILYYCKTATAARKEYLQPSPLVTTIIRVVCTYVYLCEYANIIRITLMGISDREHARRGVMDGRGGWVERREGERFFHFVFKICEMLKDIMNTIVFGDWLIVSYCLKDSLFVRERFLAVLAVHDSSIKLPILYSYLYYTIILCSSTAETSL